jgi:uncharacterized protein YqhQ
LPDGSGGAILVVMDRARLLSVLGTADEAAALPRLGGMARADGVVIASERFWAFARRDGSVREGRMPSPPGFVRRVPVVRGLVRLGLAFAPLFRGRGVARRRERVLLGAALVGPFALYLLPSAARLPLTAVIAGALVLWLLRGRALFLHGAEHRAISAAESRSLIDTWDGLVRPSRFSPRCGTNFAALVLPVSVAAERFWPLAVAAYTPFVVTLLALGLTMELWELVQASRHRVARVFLLPGLALQQLTTREPSVEETQVALTAVASVLRRESLA